MAMRRVAIFLREEQINKLKEISKINNEGNVSFTIRQAIEDIIKKYKNS
jgi:metal-responsive CopG/Arc/MetJ family transcriptional regulator